MVAQGQLIAVIDPKETSLQLQQSEAQLSGAVSAVSRQSLEINQRRKTVMAAYNQARTRVAQLELEMKAQPTLTKSAINQAEAALASAKQDRDRLINSVHPTQRITAQSTVSEAQANYDNAEREFQRQSDLLAKGYVSGRLADTAKLNFDLAKVRLDSAKESLAKLDAQLRAEASKADEAVRQSQAALTSAKANGIQDEMKRQDYLSAIADLDKARAALEDPAILQKQKDQNQSTVVQLQSVVNDGRRQLGETEIHAPLAGVVTKRGLQVGELASGLSQFSSGTTIVKIEDRRTMRVKLDVNEIDVAKMSVGMNARIDVDALPNDAFEGVVKKIAPASKESASGVQSSDAVVRYEVEIQITNPKPALRSGMSAKCTINVTDQKNVVSVPVEYVQKDNGRYFVYFPAATPTSKPEKKQISVGAMSATMYEVTSGLKEGDTIQKPPFSGPDRQGMMQAGGD
jgi:HlyD family secretion protein